MNNLNKICCGLDVHKKSITACIRRNEKGAVKSEVRRFGAMTRDLRQLQDWLKQNEVIQVAMESTGVYWKPVWNILEGHFELLLVNAQHIKHVPGRKTDIKDCEWIAELLQNGLLKSSFVPDRRLRELRDLTRNRTVLSRQKAAVANRIQKVLEDANIKLSSVASDVLGVSGRAMIHAIIAGNEDPEDLSEMSLNHLRKKIPQLKIALEGKITDHHRFMLRMFMEQLNYLESKIEEMSLRIAEVTRPFQKEIELADSIPGIARRSAENILAEIGFDMNQFPTAKHLASWGGLCPGNNESAGKHRSGKTRKGNKWLGAVLAESAWAASCVKNSYLSALYKRIAARRGKKRAMVAVGHSIIVALYHMLQTDRPYLELGSEHFLNLNPERYRKYHIKKLEQLGYSVSLEESAEKDSA